MSNQDNQYICPADDDYGDDSIVNMDILSTAYKKETSSSFTLYPDVNVQEVKITNKDLITMDQMQKMWPHANSKKREAVRRLLNKYMPEFQINTPLRIAHLLAHIHAEVGASLEGKTEDLFYSADALRFKFDRYFKHYPSEVDKLAYKGRIDRTEYDALSITQKSKYTLNSKGTKAFTKLADEEEIAKRVYACHKNDGYFTLVKGGHKSGELYRGKGFIQLTWKCNYEKVNEVLNKKLPQEKLDIVNDPYSVLNTREGILTALGFWEWQTLNKRADNGADDKTVDSITDIVNKKTDPESRKKRKDNFESFYKIMGGK